MRFKIHRGASEIGGSCVEVWTESTRLVIDFGLPLMNADKTPFDNRKYKKLNRQELLNQGILPDIPGLYEDGNTVHVLLSHAHQDHYGLINHLHPNCPVHFGEPTHTLMRISSTFIGLDLQIGQPNYYISEQPFTIGDIEITPYLMDHSAYDAHAFYIKAGGKTMFYTGDFRDHGRKTWILENLEKKFKGKVDYLLLEGTTLSRSEEKFQTESDLEEDFRKLFSENQGMHLVYTSGQNIDRIISILRACIETDRIMLVDFYIAYILKELNRFNKNIPYPSLSCKTLKVYYPKRLTNRFRNRKQEFTYPFVPFKIAKDKIDLEADRTVMLVRPSMLEDLDYLHFLKGGTFVYSMWQGYKSDSSTQKLIKLLSSKGMEMLDLHTSGHADVPALRKMISILKPGQVVPIHTLVAHSYVTAFPDVNILMVKDGESI